MEGKEGEGERGRGRKREIVEKKLRRLDYNIIMCLYHAYM